MPSHCAALQPALPSELLEYILAHQAYPTTIIICQPRSQFLQSLLVSVTRSSNLSSEPTESPTLLSPVLAQVAASKHIGLVFVPTLAHLRAYLAAFPPEPLSPPPPPALEAEEGNSQRGSDDHTLRAPLLVVYGLVELHRETSEWSAQGLSSMMASLVEAGWRSERKVMVIEEKVASKEYAEEKGSGVEDNVRAESMGKGWDERIPILNGGVRRAGLEGTENGGWSGRTVPVGRVLGRWCIFAQGDWPVDNSTLGKKS